MKLGILRKTDLVLQALRLLAASDGRLSTQELAATVGSTAAYLPQVMRPLVRNGWVVSSRGPTGGYDLVADPAGISMRDLIEAVEGPIDDGQCVLRPSPCLADTPCAIHESWRRARTALVTELERTGVVESDEEENES